MVNEKKPESILVVDDEPGIAELISDFCDSMGYKVHTCVDSEKAFEIAKREKPNLITLDLQMPNIDGFELLKKLKGDPDTCHIPVIIVSILAGEAARQDLLSAAQAILTKPINFRKFREKIDHYVKEKSASKEA